jgi:Protein of unknown function (DUF4230)
MGVMVHSGPRRSALATVKGGAVVAGLAAIAVVVVMLANSVGNLFHFSLFGTNQIDRSAPVVLKKLQDVSVYTAATGEFGATIDIEDDVKFVPSFIAGERTIFTAVGSVDATVDFSRLSGDAVGVTGDDSVTVTLPEPKLAKAVVDPARSHVANRDRGIVNRVSGMFTDSPTSERELYLTAQHRIHAAAQKSELKARAEKNTEKMLRGLLGKLGYENVSVVFGNAPTAAETQQ